MPTRGSVSHIDLNVRPPRGASVSPRHVRNDPGIDLPEAVSAAVIDLITGSLIENPRRVGRELRNELAGIQSARRGSYRILYRIDDHKQTVTVLRLDHRGDVYRTR